MAWPALTDAESPRWLDVAHVVHELVGVDRATMRDLSAGRRLLDVGCGPGYLIRQLKRRGYDVRGVDSDRELLAQAPSDIEMHVAFFDLTAKVGLTSWYKPFDVITCFDVLGTFPAEHAERAVGHLCRALKPNGVLIATIDTLEDWEIAFWEDQFTSAGLQLLGPLAHRLRWFSTFSRLDGVFVALHPSPRRGPEKKCLKI